MVMILLNILMLHTYMPNPILFYVLSSCLAGLATSKSVDSFIFFFFLLYHTQAIIQSSNIFCVPKNYL